MVVFLIPEYNEEQTILDVLGRAEPFADLVVVVDDGSHDESQALVRDWCESHGKVALLSHARNRGMSGALRTGFRYVLELREQGLIEPDSIVVTLDADGQHLPEEAGPAVDELSARGVDVLLGRRDLSGYPRSKQIGNRLLSLWASWLSGYRFYDVECGFRLMRVAVIADIMPFFTGRNYGCAQELGILPVRRGWKVDNTLPTRVAFYRKGARIRDGLTNMRMGLVAFLRVTLGLIRQQSPADSFEVTCDPGVLQKYALALQ